MTTTYTTERLNFFNEEIRSFFIKEGPEISKRFGFMYDYNFANYTRMVESGIFLVGRKNGEICGFHVSWLGTSSLDMRKKILQQQIFYVKPESGRMAYHLFKKFIDIGKSEANHIITMLTIHSNIKPETLRKWGFKEIETVYRMEIFR